MTQTVPSLTPLPPVHSHQHDVRDVSVAIAIEVVAHITIAVQVGEVAALDYQAGCRIGQEGVDVAVRQPAAVPVSA